jgi:hypothetical protein
MTSLCQQMHDAMVVRGLAERIPDKSTSKWLSNWQCSTIKIPHTSSGTDRSLVTGVSYLRLNLSYSTLKQAVRNEHEITWAYYSLCLRERVDGERGY